ncbi:MAG: hypothetical protein QOJ86_2777, partial [Bradyrhizobium sp.]|nr:hypothetical protein [Bradyrhizobium sp.]
MSTGWIVLGVIGRPRRGCDGRIDDDGPVQRHLGVVAQQPLMREPAFGAAGMKRCHHHLGAISA